MEEIIRNLKVQIIESLNLEDITPEEIDTEAPLFGDGLGLDSIDALEIMIILEKHYNIRIACKFKIYHNRWRYCRFN